MSVKIFNGSLKSLNIMVPADLKCRPTSIMLRRKIFDANQDLSNSLFIDLCAGSGAMGLEAASRGANKIIFVEKDKKFFKVLQNNIDNAIKLSQKMFSQSNFNLRNDCAINFVQKDLVKTLEASIFERVILFFDPPYENHDMYETVLKSKELTSCQKMDNFSLWIESDKDKGLSLEEIRQLVSRDLIKAYEHSSHFIAVF